MPTATTAGFATHDASDWRAALREAIRTTVELCEILELTPEQIEGLRPGDSEFPLLVPRSYVRRMRKGTPSDPLLRQVLPLAREQAPSAGFVADPLEERAVTRGGLVEKYAGRALLITTAACPIHCRYCFRRHFPYAEQTAAREDWRAAAAALARDTRIEEVILSGGDPLSLSNGRLAALITRLESIEHLTTLRIHTRFPIVLPERVDTGLLELIRRTRMRTVVVVHCNHAQEIDAAVTAALGALRRAGALVLNQSVLLRGVNDDADTLAALSRALFRAGALPYYLHALDRVAGAAHFDVDTVRGFELVESIRGRLPGYLVPRFVRELPGELSKTVLG